MAIHDSIRRHLTYEDYLGLPEDGLRHEILDGEHYVTAAPFTIHQRVSLAFVLAMGTFIEENRIGELLAAPVDVILSPHDVVQPDLLFIASPNAAIVTEKNIQGAPDLVIEILSDKTRNRDDGIKRETYSRFGVREYWLADPARRTILVDRLEGNRFRRVAHLSAAAGDVLNTPLLPGLEIELSKIFR